MKKAIIPLLVIVTLLFAFTSCSKTDKIIGRWTANYTMNFNTEILDSTEYPFVGNTQCTYKLVFNDDGLFALSRSVSDDQKAVAVDGFISLYSTYFKENHTDAEIAEMIKKSETCTTEDELINALLLNAAKSKGFSSTADYICNQLGINNAELYRGTYKMSGKQITMTPNGDGAKELTAVYDNNGIALTVEGETIIFEAENLG